MTTKTTDQTTLPPLPDPRAMNGVRHGILSELVPAWEREGYAAHVRAIRDSVGATDYLQERLADRAALALWRLDRVARWEAGELEADRRRFYDRLQSPALPSFQMPGLRPAPAHALSLQESLELLEKLTGETAAVLVRDPETVELCAQDSDREAGAWAALLEGRDPAELSDQEAGAVGVDLLSALTGDWGADPTRVARLMLGRKPTRDEAQAVADWDWTVEPREVPALVREAVRLAGREAWEAWLLQKQHAAQAAAMKLRDVGARLPDLLRQGELSATEPDVKRIDRITRYEAHLERLLYRALRELRDLQGAGVGDVGDAAQTRLAAAAEH